MNEPTFDELFEESREFAIAQFGEEILSKPELVCSIFTAKIQHEMTIAIRDASQSGIMMEKPVRYRAKKR